MRVTSCAKTADQTGCEATSRTPCSTRMEWSHAAEVCQFDGQTHHLLDKTGNDNYSRKTPKKNSMKNMFSSLVCQRKLKPFFCLKLLLKLLEKECSEKAGWESQPFLTSSKGTNRLHPVHFSTEVKKEKEKKMCKWVKHWWFGSIAVCRTALHRTRRPHFRFTKKKNVRRKRRRKTESGSRKRHPLVLF